MRAVARSGDTRSIARWLSVLAIGVAATCTPPHARAPTTPTRLDALRIRPERPRIWLDEARVAWLRAKVAGRSREEVADLAGPSAPGMALTAIATGDPAPCHHAIERFANAGTPAPHLAVVYDWCHPHLASDERAKLRALLAPRMVEAMADGRAWRSFHNAGHTHAFELALSAIALHGDDPIGERALAFLRPELDDMLETLDRVFPDGEWAEGADYARHASHHALRTLLALKTATGKDLAAASPHLRNIADYIFYAAKPNGLLFPGDDDDFPYVNAWEHRALLLIASEYRDPHAQWFLNHCPFERFRLEAKDRWERLLWYDPTIPERPLDDLPLERLFRGKGLVLARTSWGFRDKSAWIAFTNGDYYGDHDHLDVNAFQIHAGGGELAIDSGRYDDDWAFTQDPEKIARSQLFNYYQRTIAHNTMLVHDPGEVFERGLVNDGGQRHLLWRGKHRNVPEDFAQGTFPSDDGTGTSDWTTNPGRWERGDITAFAATRDFVFVRGDGTRAYAPAKLSSFVRELVFVRPRLVVVFDRVVSTNPSFEKTWLLHTVDEPRLAEDGSWFEVAEGEGRLFGVPILPARRRLAKVGGPGDEFRMGDVRFAAGPRSTLNPSPLHYGEIPGAWRIEERPSEARTEDHFANVMLITDRSSDERPSVEVLANDAATLAIRVRHAPDATVTLRFAKGAAPSTSLRIERAGDVVFDAALPDATPSLP